MMQGIANTLCRTWFAMCCVIGIIVSWISCVTVHKLGGGTLESKQKRCSQICHYSFRWFLINSCPWIRISTPTMDEILRLMHRNRVFLLMNHTSFFDSVLFVGITPATIIGRYRTLMKHNLFDVPFLGGISKMVGHLPVYFQSTDENVFSVDREKQAKVMEKVRAHVAAEGGLCLFPEAKLNRTPEVLCTFRRGIFAVAEEMQMAVVTLTTTGNSDCWPIDYAFGGIPSKITMKITEVTEARHGLSAEEIRRKAEASMRADLAHLIAERRASKPKGS